MTVEAELIAAIVAAPDDDPPRMVYADHLMQRGDLRGELIAVQCRLARADAADEPIDPALVARERELLAEHSAVWEMPLRAVVDAGYVFRRGFVEHVRAWSERDVTFAVPPRGASLEEIETAAIDRTDRLGQLFEHAPLLRSLAVRADAIYRPLPPSWALLESLELHESGYPTPDVIRAALHAMPALRRLQLTTSSLVDEQLAAFLECEQPLEHLGIHRGWHVGSQPSADIGTERIATNRHLHGLRSLHLSSFELAGIDRLACLTQLERLSIASCGVEPESLIALVRQLPALTMLEYQFHDSETSRLDLTALLAAAPRLRRLALSGFLIEGDLDALTRMALRRLILERCHVGDRGARTLLAAPDLAPIELQITDDELTLQTRELVEARALRYRPAAPRYPERITAMLPVNKIGAIKEYRVVTGAGLADAKMAIEQIEEERTDRAAYKNYRAFSRWCRP